MTKRAKSIICLVMAIFFITTGPAFANKHKPTQAQIDAAKKVEAEKKAIADRAAERAELALDLERRRIERVDVGAVRERDPFLLRAREVLGEIGVESDATAQGA